MRLEHLLNDVVFQGERVVEITNMATGGQTSEWGALLLEYRLFPEPEKLPDVIISAFSANDESKEPNENEHVFYEFMQDFVKAANNLHPCDDNAPLLIMADDFYVDLPYQATRQTGDVLMLSAWYNLMAVDYASTVKYKVFAEHEGNVIHPLTSMIFNVHLGIAMHIGMAWTVMFNIVNAFANVCNYFSMGVVHDTNEKYIPPPHWGNTSSLPSTAIDASPFNESAIGVGTNETNLAALDPELLPALLRGEPPFKHFGRMPKDAWGTAEIVGSELKANIANNEALCKTLNETEQTKKCTYAWVINAMTGWVLAQATA